MALFARMHCTLTKTRNEATHRARARARTNTTRFPKCETASCKRGYTHCGNKETNKETVRTRCARLYRGASSLSRHLFINTTSRICMHVPIYLEKMLTCPTFLFCLKLTITRTTTTTKRTLSLNCLFCLFACLHACVCVHFEFHNFFEFHFPRNNLHALLIFAAYVNDI